VIAHRAETCTLSCWNMNRKSSVKGWMAAANQACDPVAGSFYLLEHPVSPGQDLTLSWDLVTGDTPGSSKGRKGNEAACAGSPRADPPPRARLLASQSERARRDGRASHPDAAACGGFTDIALRCAGRPRRAGCLTHANRLWYSPSATSSMPATRSRAASLMRATIASHCEASTSERMRAPQRAPPDRAREPRPPRVSPRAWGHGPAVPRISASPAASGPGPGGHACAHVPAPHPPPTA
jgi:hypothetical protein